MVRQQNHIELNPFRPVKLPTSRSCARTASSRRTTGSWARGCPAVRPASGHRRRIVDGFVPETTIGSLRKWQPKGERFIESSPRSELAAFVHPKMRRYRKIYRECTFNDTITIVLRNVARSGRSDYFLGHMNSTKGGPLKFAQASKLIVSLESS